MANLDVTTRRISPLSGAIIRTLIAAEAGSLGDAVLVSGNDLAEPASAAAAGTAVARGVVVSAMRSGLGTETFAAGDALSVVLVGPVTGYTGLTAGDDVFLSDTAGRLADEAGTVTKKMGFVVNAETIFVLPV